VTEAHQRGNTGGQRDRPRPLQAAGLADAEQVPHHEPEIEAAGMHQEPFENVVVLPQMRVSHAAGIVDMRKRSFHQFRPRPQQGLAALPAFAPSVRVDGRLCVGRLGPITSTTVRLRDVRPEADGLRVDQRLVAVIPLVGDDLFERLRILDVRLGATANGLCPRTSTRPTTRRCRRGARTAAGRSTRRAWRISTKKTCRPCARSCGGLACTSVDAPRVTIACRGAISGRRPMRWATTQQVLTSLLRTAPLRHLDPAPIIVNLLRTSTPTVSPALQSEPQ